MKRILFLFLVLFAAFVSCTKRNLDISYATINKDREPSYSAKDTLNNVVSMSDVIGIVERDCLLSKSTDAQFEVTPYLRSVSDTLMYIVNYKEGKGWKILSSDKRTPAILAEGDSGSFSLTDGSPAVAVWMSCVADDIARVRRSTDKELTFSENEILFNKAFWTGEQPRFNGDQPPPDYPLGHWEETVYSQTVEYDHVDHMVAHWDQAAPYNECCPFLVQNSSQRAAAGCVAIAGAQMLLFLHEKIGRPVSMYSQGFCQGDVSGYTQFFSNPSTTVWNQMSIGYQNSAFSMLPEAIMIGDVGLRVGMHYWDVLFDYFSWALPEKLKTDVFEPYGILSSRGSYDENIVKQSLLSQMPVIVSASNLLIPIDGKIHCFVIDGYRLTRTKYTHYHYYVLDEAPSGIFAMPREYYTYTYSSPQLTSIKINWGWRSQWASQPVNDGWYSLTGGWTVNLNDEEFDYNYYRMMTYGFAALDN